MQIRMFTENNINVTVGRVSQEKERFEQTTGGIFDSPQCKVTISKEGRKLSEQSDRQPSRSAQELKEEKLILRQQEESEQAEETENEYLDLLKQLTNTIKSMNNSSQAGEDKETIEKKQQVLRALREQKQKQLEENQKKAKEAQEMAMQSSEVQDEVDKNNRDLLVMLKSIEESDMEEEEEQKKGKKADENGSNGIKKENSVGDIIENSASQFMASSVKRELNAVDMIQTLHDEGHAYLDKANEIVRNALDEAEDLKKLLADAEYTDAEKEEAVSRYQVKVMAGYSDLNTYRRRGLQMIKDAKECRIEHIKYNPLQGMEETKDSMMQSSVDAAFHEAAQGKLDETSQELEDEVEELIDERNDVDHTEPADEEKETQESEKVGENLNAMQEDEDNENVTQG